MFRKSCGEEWILLSVLLALWSFRLASQVHTVLLFPDGLAGLAITLAIIVVMKRANRSPTLLWDDTNRVLLIIRSWRVEACAAMLMTSVPVGIDLSHSAWKVLQSMHLSLAGGRNGVLRFFVCRPLGQGPTRAGMMIVREILKLGNSGRSLRALSDKVTKDVRTLESALKVAYPHTPVEKASLADVMMVVEGGVQSIAQPSK